MKKFTQCYEFLHSGSSICKYPKCPVRVDHPVEAVEAFLGQLDQDWGKQVKKLGDGSRIGV